MKMLPRFLLVLAVAVPLAVPGQNKSDNAKRRDDLDKPLVIASQGSFFVGGETN
jgi:hypothetical protein